MLKQSLIILIVLLVTGSLPVKGQQNVEGTSGPVKVFKLDIKSDIDPRSNRYTDLALAEAEKSDADYVVIEMDTYGGALNDADDIRTRVMNFEKPIYVWINKDAASAGALISIACDSIYMTDGASIGAATVVTADQVAAPDKYQSYMRSIMRSTAEATGRDPKIAEAMVDENIEIEGISSKGSVITFSTSEAIKHGFCEASVSGIDEIMARSGVTDYVIEEYETSVAEEIISFFLNPFVSGILVLVIMGGIYFELQTPGVGFPLLAAIIAIIFYLTPYYLNGLAENWEIIAFFIGLILIALEVFVIPGFGVAGISGLILTVGSLVLVMLDNDYFDFTFVKLDDAFIATAAIVAGFTGAIILFFFGGNKLADSKAFKKISLGNTMDSESGYTSNFNRRSMLGMQGVTYTILRPSGKILIEGELYDAYARSSYIEKDSHVEVIGQEGTSLKVKQIDAPDKGNTGDI
ncbi:MAG: NfeD family protein [Cyclobacteriaceae bacterium]